MTTPISIIRILPHGFSLPLPSYQTEFSSGMDLLAACEEEVFIKPGERRLIPTGIAIALPEGFEAQIRPRSGLALKHGLTCLNSPGTIDADYRGEIKVLLINFGEETYSIKRGDRIAQMVISKFEKIEWQEKEVLPQSIRGQGGFGSTG